jgi:predicted DNA-binding transcriptional regulator AlpA
VIFGAALRIVSPFSTNGGMQMQPDPDELFDMKAACIFFGGNRPLHPATFYRGIRKGRYPAPIKVGPGSSRWLRSECAAALQSMIARRRAAQ